MEWQTQWETIRQKEITRNKKNIKAIKETLKKEKVKTDPINLLEKILMLDRWYDKTNDIIFVSLRSYSHHNCNKDKRYIIILMDYPIQKEYEVKGDGYCYNFTSDNFFNLYYKMKPMFKTPPNYKPLKQTEMKKEQKETAKAETADQKIMIVSYSEKAVAVFGQTKPIRELLKEQGGRFNPYLKKDGENCPGWIFSKKREAQLREVLKVS